MATDVAVAASGRSTTTGHLKQKLIARTAGGHVPNGPSAQPTISWDGRIARYVAYASTATDIREGSSGRSNVYLVKRNGGGRNGTPWRYGSTKLMSRGRDGQAGNGQSFAPSLGGASDGDRARGARCLAFVSSSSNLVASDTNGRSDVFLRRLPSGKTRRVAAPAGASASDVAVSGNCATIAVVASGNLYRKRGGHGWTKLAGGGVSSARVSASGARISYAQNGRVYVRANGSRKVGTGKDPAPEAGARRVAFERGGVIFYKTLGGGTRRIGTGTAPHPTAGGQHVMFGRGRFVYLYAMSNNFGKRRPQGACPRNQGNVTSVQPSGRGNYIVFSCSGGRVYLSYVGPK